MSPARPQDQGDEHLRTEVVDLHRDLLRWGLVPRWAKDPSGGARLMNARADGVADKPSFREAFARRRIYPNGVTSLTEDALLWRPPTLSLRQKKLAFGRLRFAGDPGVPASQGQLKRQARLLGDLVTQRKHLDEGLSQGSEDARVTVVRRPDARAEVIRRPRPRTPSGRRRCAGRRR